jgi:DNA replication protein DnaC
MDNLNAAMLEALTKAAEACGDRDADCDDDARNQEALERMRLEQRAARVASRRARHIACLDAPLSAADRQALTDRTLDDTPALAIVRGWAAAASTERGKRVLVLLGAPGAGKTIAACWLLSQHGRSRYTKIRDLCRLFRADWGDDRKAYEALVNAPTLVVDELGTERDAMLASAALQELIDERQKPGVLTLLVGNLTREEFLGGYSPETPSAGRYDPRTYDRLRAVGVLRQLSGLSLRRGSL